VAADRNRACRGATTYQRGNVLMPAGPRLFIGAAVAALGAAIDPVCHAETAQIPISNAREVRAALQACWVAPENGPRQVSVRFGFNREGRVVGQPLITYQNPPPSEEGRKAVRDALAQTITRCEPLPLSDAFRKVVSVRPITVRLGEGWKRRGQAKGGSEPQSEHQR
jgi:hypothetical protein